jgi:N6-adenosine-specific RNA methylase IME4
MKKPAIPALYDVILADPPWYFKNYSADNPHELTNRGRGQQRHYPTMTEAEICALNVPANENAVLFLWACWPILPQALRVIESWGFEYKSLAWVWIKANPSGFGFFTGMGYYTRANSEPCLLATRGSLPKPRNRGVQALIYSPVKEHSRKPEEQYSKIERLYPGMRFLEMFARRRRNGWDAFGNEVKGSINLG